MPLVPETDSNVIQYLDARAAGQSGQQQGGGGMQSFPGVNEDLHGDAYLKQFPSEIQSGVRDFLAGAATPTGNPRRLNIIKMVASRYGQDIGMPADETAFAERRTLRNDLARGTPQSVGGQLRNGTTAMEHLSEVARYAHELGNWSGFGIAPLGHAINQLRGFGTEQQAKAKAMQAAVDHYGQEIIKFYAGSGGGQAERQAFEQKLSAANTPEELAAVIESEGRLIPGKMDQIREEVRTKLGPFVAKEFEEKFASQERSAQKFGAYVHALRTGKPPQLAKMGAQDLVPGAVPGASPPGGPAPGGSAGGPPVPLGGPPAGPQAAPGAFAPPPGAMPPPPGMGAPAGLPGPQTQQMGAPAATMSSGRSIPEGATAVNRNTGQRIIMRGGNWMPIQ